MGKADQVVVTKLEQELRECRQENGKLKRTTVENTRLVAELKEARDKLASFKAWIAGKRDKERRKAGPSECTCSTCCSLSLSDLYPKRLPVHC